MANKKGKAYVFISGKHVGTDGKKYVKGDRILLTPRQALFLVNKVKPLESGAPAVEEEEAPQVTRDEVIEALKKAKVKFGKEATDEELWALYQGLTDKE